jgi:hypothetical protein
MFDPPPLFILTFLLFLFLFSVFLERRVEGFILFQQSTPVFNQVIIDEYAMYHVAKVYDNIYFDQRSGNVVIVDGKSDGDDATSASLSEITVLSRVSAAPPASMKVSITTRVPGAEFKVDNEVTAAPSTINNYNYYMYPEAAVKKPTLRYQIAYISCGTDTLLHVYDKDIMVNVGTYLFRHNQDPIKCLAQQGFKYDGKDTVSGGDATKYNRYVHEPLYDATKTKSVFQLTKYVYFDTTCRYLIVKKGGALTVYDGTMGNDGITPLRVYRDVVEMGVVRNTPKTLSATSAFQVQYMNDVDGGNFVLYVPIPSSKQTIIAIFRLHPVMNGNLELIDSIIFDQDSPNGINGKNEISSQVLGGNACRSAANGRVADGGGRAADGRVGGAVATNNDAVATNNDDNPSYSRNLNSYFNRELNLDRHLTYGSEDAKQWMIQAQQRGGFGFDVGEEQMKATLASIDAGAYARMSPREKAEIQRMKQQLNEQAQRRQKDAQAQRPGNEDEDEDEDEEEDEDEDEDEDVEKEDEDIAMQKKRCKNAKDPAACMLSTSVAGYNSAYMLKTKYIPSIPMRQKKKTEAEAEAGAGAGAEAEAKAQSTDPMANLWR